MSTGYVLEDAAVRAAPHLARSRDPRGDPALDACAQAVGNVDFGETRIEEIIVYQSELTSKGGALSALARVPLERIGTPERGALSVVLRGGAARPSFEGRALRSRWLLSACAARPEG